MPTDDTRIAVIGLGYVGLPLAVEFARRHPVVGFDISAARIEELRQGRDSSLEVSPTALIEAGIRFTQDTGPLHGCNVYIVTVPTPIDAFNSPDLRPLLAASRTVGQVIDRGDLVVFESTVYPGATEDDCVPVIEAVSGLVHNRDFLVGYSPERINPGDPEHRVTGIRKVTAGANPEAADRVDALYASIIPAGTHRTSSIRVAEAAKVIENTQRDVNIALINELAMIFARLGIDTEEVLEAAATKWNFLPFRPGLVGGHCIGVDPYYLTHKAQAIGYHPAMILAGRRVNDGMGAYVATTVVKQMLRRGLAISGSRVLVMGLTFKENCPDLRNTRVVDIIDELASFGATVEVWDPWVGIAQAREAYGITPITQPADGRYDGIVIAVAHRQFAEIGIDRIRAFGTADAVVFDVKYLFPAEATDGRL
jgi:UDP-N-acetyl-D-glucosamine/UDP-N-acetyl-D-galactosamine dehydrogenase